MKTPNPSDLDKVLKKINEIAKESADGDYIYRGEPEHYEKVSSSLYRESPHIEGIHFDIERVQATILEEAKVYISKTDNIDETDDIGILTELQHFGGKTNLIDFTEDYLIALFFACDGSHGEDGRIILLKRDDSETYKVRKPRQTISRVESQKSVFVESLDGFITPNIEVSIPADLKFPILKYLRRYHRISIETIYNDLHGFIRRSAHTEFLKGLTCQRKASESETDREKREHCENAIKHYTEALKLKSDFAEAYYNRGVAYGEKGDFDQALQDYSKAIDLNPNFAEAYCNRGVAYGEKGDFDQALQDYSKAITLKPQEAITYNNRGVAYFAKDKVDAALRDYSKAIDLNPKYAEVYYNRGNAYGKKGDFDAAIQNLNKAIELDPELAEVSSNRDNTYVLNLLKGDFDAAIQSLSAAIALNPKYAEVYYNRGLLRLHLREWQKAKGDLTAAKDMGTDIVASFHKGYESVEDFEAKNEVKMPEDIAALLRGE